MKKSATAAADKKSSETSDKKKSSDKSAKPTRKDRIAARIKKQEAVIAKYDERRTKRLDKLAKLKALLASLAK